MRFCRICSKEFAGKTNSVYCSTECAKKGRKARYKENKHVKPCNQCQREFCGTKKQILCSECKQKKLLKKYELMEVSVLCRVCGEEMYKEYKNKTIGKNTRVGKTCCECKRISLLQKSARMRSNNPMKTAQVRAAVASSISGEKKHPEDYQTIRSSVPRMSQEEVSKLLSERMSGDSNPMKCPEVRDKVAQLLKTKYKTGEIKCPSGPEHWLWKGNRERSQTIRSRLYPTWIRPILERDDFTCCRCKKRGGRLEVHHVDPSFQDIVEKHLNGKKLVNLTESEFSQFSDEIVKLHKNVVGITYCRKCHLQVEHESKESKSKKICG